MICRAWRPTSVRPASQSPSGAGSSYSAPVASVIRSMSSSRPATYRYSEAAPVPSPAATRRIDTAASPSASAMAIAAATISAWVCPAGRPAGVAWPGRAGGVGTLWPPLADLLLRTAFANSLPGL